MKNIHLRLITGFFYIALMISSAWIGGFFLNATYFVLLLFCSYEWWMIFKNKHPNLKIFPIFINNILFFLLFLFFYSKGNTLSELRWTDVSVEKIKTIPLFLLFPSVIMLLFLFKKEHQKIKKNLFYFIFFFFLVNFLFLSINSFLKIKNLNLNFENGYAFFVGLSFIVIIFNIYLKTIKKSDTTFLVGLAAPAYIALGLGSLLAINYRYTENNEGFILLFIYFSIWFNDSFAYLVGSKIGKTPLFPRISPKKTWEGFLGGLVLSSFFMFLILIFTTKFDFLNLLYWIGLNILISILANLGDLVESFFKRHAQVKDSSQLLPGHGGFLDRLDSLLFVGPFLLFLIEIFKV